MVYRPSIGIEAIKKGVLIMKKMLGAFLLGVFVMSIGVHEAGADAIDILVKKLEEKGILTQNEAKVILEEAKRELAKETAETVPAPEWTERVSIKGDIRYRNQFDWQDNDNRKTRWRQRIRARLGVTGKVSDEIYGGMRFVSGDTNPISTNQTLGDFFGTKALMLDQAYIAYTPEMLGGHLTAWGGMFDNPFYSTEMLWDTDISFGGAAFTASMNANEIPWLMNMKIPSTDLFAAFGMFPLDEINSTREDPWMWGIQGGFNSKIINGVSLKTAMAFYDYSNVVRYVENHSQGGNIAAIEAGFGKGFEVIDFPVEIGIDNPLRCMGMESGKNPIVPYFAAYGDYANNLSTGEGDNAWMVGTKIGHKNVNNPGSWQLSYDFRDIESNAQIDVFPDSEFYGTGTGAYGHDVRLEYGMVKNATLGAEWYYTTRKAIAAVGDDRTRSLLEIDAKVKF